MADFSVVLAFRNREAIIADWMERLVKAAPEGLDWEMILVNSASSDGSEKVLAGLGSRPEFSGIKYLKLDQHEGLGQAQHQGLLKTEGAVIGLSRIDGQWDPADLFRAYDLLVKKGADKPQLIRGRLSKKSSGRAWSVRLAGLISTLILWGNYFQQEVQPKVFPRSLVAYLGQPLSGQEYDLYLLFRAGLKGYKTLWLEVSRDTAKRKLPRGWLKSLVLGALKIRVSLEP